MEHGTRTDARSDVQNIREKKERQPKLPFLCQGWLIYFAEAEVEVDAGAGATPAGAAGADAVAATGAVTADGVVTA